MDPPISFPDEWYPVTAVVLSGILVAMVTSLVSWKLISWLRTRKRRYHEPLLNDGRIPERRSKIMEKLMGIFFKGHAKTGYTNGSDKKPEEYLEDAILKRSSTVHSRTSLISTGSSSRASSIPPIIVQSCQPQDIHIPERRQSSFSVESTVELGHFQTDSYKSEQHENEPQQKIKGQRSKLGANSSINEAVEDGKQEIDEEEEEEENNKDESDNLDDSSLESAGSLMFSLEHDMHRESLTVTVMKASDLRLLNPSTPVTSGPAQNEPNNSSSSKESLASTGQLPTSAPLFDPYVRIMLLPEGKQKAKTRIVRRTRNPVFEETFTFYGIGSHKLAQTIVKLSVMNHDRFAKDGFMGQVVLPLTSKLMKRDRHAVTLCRNIVLPSQKPQKQGELFISLNFDPATDKLTVVVLKGRNFPKMDISGLADPYVKVYLICDGQRIEKKKTQVKKRTLNPVFNETFHIIIPPHHHHHLLNQQPAVLGESGSSGSSDYSSINAPILLRFVILDWDRVSKNETIGRVEIGPEVVSEVAVKHWNDVMECPRKQLAVWHKLE